MKIILEGEPKSTGALYKINCVGRFPRSYMVKAGADLKESYQWQAKTQWRKPIIDGDVEVSIHLFFGTKRKCDVDNFNKILLDSLTGIVWLDDSQIQKLTITKGYDKLKPRIEVEIL